MTRRIKDFESRLIEQTHFLSEGKKTVEFILRRETEDDPHNAVLIWVREPVEAEEIAGIPNAFINADIPNHGAETYYSRREGEQVARRSVSCLFETYWTTLRMGYTYEEFIRTWHTAS